MLYFGSNILQYDAFYYFRLLLAQAIVCDVRNNQLFLSDPVHYVLFLPISR